MWRLTRRAAILAAGLIAIGGVAACGSDRKTADEAVVHVAGHSITKSTVDHWIPIEAIISREPIPRHPIPAGEVPDPPHFTACIAYLQKSAPRAANGAAPNSSGARLKNQCQKHFEAVRRHMIQILISYAWTSAEAASWGIKVSDAEVERKFAQFKHEQYPTEAIFQSFLKYTGENLSDELLLERFDILAGRLERKVIQRGGVAGATRFYREFPKIWAAKTNCSPGYVVPNCKQYKGPLSPEAQI
jgi:foldase protein PrsA